MSVVTDRRGQKPDPSAPKGPKERALILVHDLVKERRESAKARLIQADEDKRLGMEDSAVEFSDMATFEQEVARIFGLGIRARESEIRLEQIEADKKAKQLAT